MAEPVVAPSPTVASPSKYARLPDPIAPEDMVATQDPGPLPYQRGEFDTDVEWLLRTVGLG
ncbi:hypothetical protein [Nocardioides aurantiacus]|uniref:Uncharacterized protein n=1 Tax=Nocardioides aurantiacus TaxID=86796 RepID=A0A3N2CV92_9ACTN|nr:hypothetical protein [Nocardioides aurantiacus]ROR91457.1 hypothetical protein EDD33_2324 [Nocardioides aurantiacus]